MLIGTVVLLVVAGTLGYVLWPLALIVLPVLVWLFACFREGTVCHYPLSIADSNTGRRCHGV